MTGLDVVAVAVYADRVTADTATRVDAQLYVNAHKISEAAALDLSIVLAVAAQRQAIPNHTRTEANHGR